MLCKQGTADGLRRRLTTILAIMSADGLFGIAEDRCRLREVAGFHGQDQGRNRMTDLVRGDTQPQFALSDIPQFDHGRRRETSLRQRNRVLDEAGFGRAGENVGGIAQLPQLQKPGSMLVHPGVQDGSIIADDMNRNAAVVLDLPLRETQLCMTALFHPTQVAANLGTTPVPKGNKVRGAQRAR